VVGIEGVAEEQLAGEHPERALGHLELDVLAAGGRASFGLDGEDVAFDVEVDRVGGHPGKVEGHHELVTGAVGVHRHRRGTRPGARGVAEHLLGQAVQLPEGVGTHQHRSPLLSCSTLKLRCVRSGGEGLDRSDSYNDNYRFPSMQDVDVIDRAIQDQPRGGVNGFVPAMRETRPMPP
jgi:hypothetical protein